MSANDDLTRFSHQRAVLVTGGAGLAGSHVARRIQVRGRHVIVLDDLSSGHRDDVSPEVPFVEGSVGDVALVKRIVAAHEIGSVVHFPSDHEKSRSLLQAVSEAGVRGFVLSVRASSEDEPMLPPAPDGMAWCTLRCFDERELIVAALDAAFGDGPPVVIAGHDHPTPDGTRVRDYLHIEDLAEAHVAALDAVEHGVSPGTIEIGSGRGHSDREILECVGAVVRRPVPHTYGPRNERDVPRLVADPRLASSELGWRVKRPSLTMLVQDVLREHARHRAVEHLPETPWDGVDEASWESFPASDPPAHP